MASRTRSGVSTNSLIVIAANRIGSVGIDNGMDEQVVGIVAARWARMSLIGWADFFIHFTETDILAHQCYFRLIEASLPRYGG